MKILRWLREYGSLIYSPCAPPPCSTADGIEPEWRSQWRPDESGVETRRHVGRSAEGFHPGIEVCYCRIEWGAAQPTAEMARVLSAELEEKRRSEKDREHAKGEKGGRP